MDNIRKYHFLFWVVFCNLVLLIGIVKSEAPILLFIIPIIMTFPIAIIPTLTTSGIHYAISEKISAGQSFIAASLSTLANFFIGVAILSVLMVVFGWIAGVVGSIYEKTTEFYAANLAKKFNFGITVKAEDIGELKYPYWSKLFGATCNTGIVRQQATTSETEAESMNTKFISSYSGKSLALGLTNEEIIKHLYISPEDAKFYTWNAFEIKFGGKRGIAQDGFVEYKTAGGNKFIGYTIGTTMVKAGRLMVLCFYENDSVSFDGWNNKFHTSIENFEFY